MLDLEKRAISAFEKLGVAMTNTCINYQTIQAPTRNEHVAFGDTGVFIYSKYICSARSNFKRRTSPFVAGLTGSTPRHRLPLTTPLPPSTHAHHLITPSTLHHCV